MLLPIRVSPCAPQRGECDESRSAALRIVLGSGVAIEVPPGADEACAVSLARALSC
jgi:hypothetical protein